jgi:hypothetical protein
MKTTRESRKFVFERKGCEQDRGYSETCGKVVGKW